MYHILSGFSYWFYFLTMAVSCWNMWEKILCHCIHFIFASSWFYNANVV